MRLTADVILRADATINPCKERELDLRGYKIPVIENVGATQDMFDTIDFSDNEIKKLENFPRMERLTTLLFNNNHISKIAESMKDQVPNLSTLVLTNNRIQHLAELDSLQGLRKLTLLSLLENPVVRRQHYRLYVIHRCPALKYLDFRKVKQQERQEAARLFKSKAGQQMQDDVQKEIKTFQAGEKQEREKKRLTEDQKNLIREAIKNATTPEEVDKLERQLKAGIMPNLAQKGPSNTSGAPPVPSPAPAPTPAPDAMDTEEKGPSNTSGAPPVPSPAPAPTPAPDAMDTEESLAGAKEGAAGDNRQNGSHNALQESPPAPEMAEDLPANRDDAMETEEATAAPPEAPASVPAPVSVPQTAAQEPTSPESTTPEHTAPEPASAAPAPPIASQSEATEDQLTDTQIKQMTVKELKTELQKRRLATSGLKAALAQRLLEACGL